ncbi:MAG: tRNA lysidine(34) synthetase TilS, partial [Clostridia bacterium]|nr:tRNA lysidine(34) synthetase TilS [Clostridia bacterium]
MKSNLEKIEDTIKKYQMFSLKDKILVAFSGGCDSVCLALCLNKLGYNIALAHVNHGIRKTADNDEKFCVEFAKKLNIPIFISKPDVTKYALDNKISVETAGRILRYEFFYSLNEYNYIATAHHKNDLAETVLQHLVRGTGCKGLTGIIPVRDNIVRPLIELDRAEIEDIVSSLNEEYCTDST